MHDEHSRSRSERWLARQLRDEARREQPQFSESLHDRIMQAVRPAVAGAIVPEPICAEPATERRNRVPRHRIYWRSAALLTAAAAIFVMVIASRWFIGRESHSSPQPSQSVVVRPGTSAKQAVEPAGSKSVEVSPDDIKPNDLASLAANYTLDDLSRDAQATAHLLVDQLPFETPAEEWGL